MLTEGWNSKPLYATLSHCWGKPDFLQLRSHNEHLFRNSIPYHELPKTFKDALEFVRSLGLEYVWIDSLCIIQDSELDWLKEAARMSSVYKGSYINIAASGSKDAHGGLPVNSNGWLCGFRAEVSPSCSNANTKNLLQFEMPFFDHLAMWQSHLSTRAWAFQEKILSPRSIHFCKSGIFWECPRGRFNDSLMEGLLQQADPQFKRGLLQQYRETESLYDWWDAALWWYSRASITRPRDRLPAISGIVRELHGRFDVRYLAGIWYDHTIEEQLCWKLQEHEPLRPRPKYRAPSWSWASVDSSAGLIGRRPDRKIYSHVLDAQTLPSYGQDSFGEVNGGWIKIACSSMLIGQFSGYETIVVSSSDGNFELQCSLDCSDDCEIGENTRCWILPLLDTDSTTSDFSGYNPRGLLLLHTERSPGEFRRIGSVMAWDWDETEHIRFDQILGSEGREIALSHCAEVIENTEHPNETFVIMIV